MNHQDAGLRLNNSRRHRGISSTNYVNSILYSGPTYSITGRTYSIKGETCWRRSRQRRRREMQ